MFSPTEFPCTAIHLQIDRIAGRIDFFEIPISKRHPTDFGLLVDEFGKEWSLHSLDSSESGACTSALRRLSSYRKSVSVVPAEIAYFIGILETTLHAQLAILKAKGVQP